MQVFVNLIIIIAVAIEIFIIYMFFELFNRVKKLEVNQKEIIDKIKSILGIEEKNNSNEKKEEFNKPEDWLR